MRHTKEQLLSRLQELQVELTKYDHPAVLTVEAQAKYVGDVGSALSKNLFLKDKKQRFYIVSALASTNVDLKVLSQQLGLGKGGVKMAPEEALGEILQVPLCCVAPFAVINESARHVSLLLDQGFKSQKSCIFHPLSNDTSIALSANDLDKFLKSVGREPSYVDLEANPKVGKDQPPDLAALVPSDSISLPEVSDEAPYTESTTIKKISADIKPNAVKAKAVKTNDVVKAKDKASGLQPCTSFTNPGQFIEEILDKTSTLLLSEINEDSIKEHGGNLGAVVSDNLRKRLGSEIKNLSIIFKNTAYTEGFHAGTRYQPRDPLNVLNSDLITAYWFTSSTYLFLLNTSSSVSMYIQKSSVLHTHTHSTDKT